MAAPAFAQSPQPRQYGTSPTLNSTWTDRYYRNDSIYEQPEPRTNPGGYQSDNYNAPGSYTPNRGVRLTTPGFSLSR